MKTLKRKAKKGRKKRVVIVVRSIQIYILAQNEM